MPSGVLNISPSRLNCFARTLVVTLPFLYEAIPDFMYICGMVSFSRNLRVTRGIFSIFHFCTIFTVFFGGTTIRFDRVYDGSSGRMDVSDNEVVD